MKSKRNLSNCFEDIAKLSDEEIVMPLQPGDYIEVPGDVYGD